MCLIVLCYKVHPDYPLVLAANRDEFYKRASSTARFWEDKPSILAGRDLEQGGSWLGINRHGRVAAVTNYRDGSADKKATSSRGLLVSDFLDSGDSPESFLQERIPGLHEYNDFNLLVGNIDALYFLNSRSRRYRQLDAGIHGLSNADLNSAWPKVEWSKNQLAALVEDNRAGDHTAILSLLKDDRVADDKRLPDTNIGLEWERVLSPVFIHSADYGTRASTVITIDKNSQARFSERTYDCDGKEANNAYYEFTLAGGN